MCWIDWGLVEKCQCIWFMCGQRRRLPRVAGSSTMLHCRYLSDFCMSESEKAVLGVTLLVRATINLPLRFAYPFLPAISRGLGVSLTMASALVSVRSLAGMGAPLFGVLVDRRGGRWVMALGLALMILGTTLVAGLPAYGAALVGFGMIGLAKSAYDPAMQAYISQRVPYERRGQALGIAELSWSATWLGMPLGGWLIDHLSWRAPFAAIAVVGLLGWWLTRRALAANQASHQNPPGLQNVPLPRAQRKEVLADLFLSFNHLWHDRHARLALVVTVALMLAQDNLIVVYGAWMEDAFGLTVTALGLASLVIGVAEAIAELGVALLSDRLGKRRAVSLGLALTAGGYLLLPRLTGNLTAALVGTAFAILVFEFSVVSFIPLVSGLSATARGTLMSLNVAALSAGRMIAAPLAVALYRPGDLTRNGLLSAAMCLLSLGLLSLIRERGH